MESVFEQGRGSSLRRQDPPAATLVLTLGIHERGERAAGADLNGEGQFLRPLRGEILAQRAVRLGKTSVGPPAALRTPADADAIVALVTQPCRPRIDHTGERSCLLHAEMGRIGRPRAKVLPTEGLAGVASPVADAV